MKKFSLLICLLLAIAILLVGLAHRAQASLPEQFGNSVAVSSDGSSILVGAPGVNSQAGEAFLFDSSGVLLQAYQDPNPVTAEFFGSSVAISADGSTVLVGAEFRFVTTSAGATVGAGEAFLFDSSGNLLQAYQEPSPYSADHFGVSVALSSDGGTALIGAGQALAATGPGTSAVAGGAFLFDSNGNLLQTYQDPSPTPGENFGSSVALSGDADSILIGAEFAPAGATIQGGEAFLFDSSGNLLQTYQDPNPTSGGDFGSSVALSSDGSSVLVGELFAPAGATIQGGEAFLFDTSGNLLQTYQDPNPTSGEEFGVSVALSSDGSTILIGADLAPATNGVAFLFDSSGNLLQAYQDPSPTFHEEFGISVTVSGDGSTILVGAPSATVTTSTGSTVTAGAAFLFDSSGSLLQPYQDPNL